MKTLLIDGHNLIYRCITAIHFKNANEPDKVIFDLWKHAFMNSILTSTIKFQVDSIVLTVDDEHSWRYGIYPLYKANRKAKREKSKINYKAFYPVMDSFIESIKTTFTNIRVIKVPECEGDDTIAILSKKLIDDIVIISGDSDLNQLTSDRVKQFDPMAGKFIESINVEKALQLKILMGDKGDFIPAIKPKTGPVTAAKILEQGYDEFLKTIENDFERSTIDANYKRNIELIDLSMIPCRLSNDVWEAYNNYTISPIDKMKLMSFFCKNSLMKLMSEWNSISSTIRNLK